MSKQSLNQKLKSLSEIKAGLLAKKAKNTLTPEDQVKLDEVTMAIVDIEEELAEMKTTDEAEIAEKLKADANAAEEAKKPAYVVKKEEAHLVHVELTFGKRFDAESGKEVSTPFVQMFSAKEFDAFKSHSKILGYQYKILHEPK